MSVIGIRQVTLTILSGQTLSDELDTQGDLVTEIQMPGTWTTADIYVAGKTPAGAYVRLTERSDASDYTIKAAASDFVRIPADEAWGYPEKLKLESQNAQAADRSLIVHLRRND